MGDNGQPQSHGYRLPGDAPLHEVPTDGEVKQVLTCFMVCVDMNGLAEVIPDPSGVSLNVARPPSPTDIRQACEMIKTSLDHVDVAQRVFMNLQAYSAMAMEQMQQQQQAQNIASKLDLSKIRNPEA